MDNSFNADEARELDKLGPAHISSVLEEINQAAPRNFQALRVYFIHDRAAQSLVEPVFAPTDAVAFRRFQDMVTSDPRYRNAADFRLVYLGNIDLAAGDGEEAMVAEPMQLIVEAKTINEAQR